MAVVHLEFRMTINDNATYSYNRPYVSGDVSLHVPVEFLNSKALASWIEEQVKELAKGYPRAKEEYEAEQRAEEEREAKEKAEAEGQ